jgi:hypothetical protein
MPIKGVFLPDHLQVNKYLLKIGGLPDLTPTKISGIEEELDNPDLPDRTTHTGGRSKPFEFEMELPMHHKTECAAMHAWWVECTDPVSIFHKKMGTLMIFSQSGATTSSWLLEGMIAVKRKLPDLDLDNDGEMAVIAYTIKGDIIMPAN